MVPNDIHLEIGSLLFEGLDQIDLTGPFEYFHAFRTRLTKYAKTVAPVPDVRGLRLVPDATLAEAPQLDLLHVPGGFGQEAWMEDDELLDGYGARRRERCAYFLFAQVLSFAARLVCSRDEERQRTGARFICWVLRCRSRG